MQYSNGLSFQSFALPYDPTGHRVDLYHHRFLSPFQSYSDRRATDVERKPGRLASNSNGVLTSTAGPCLVPNVTNGNVEKVAHRDVIAGAMVSHGSIMQYRCDDGFRPKLSNTTCCNNGTWLTTPICEEGDYAI